MENISKDYVFLDGVWLKQEKLLEMASQAGSMVMAEHYLCAYLANALLNGNREAIKNLNAIRRVYNLQAIPFTEEENCDSPKDDTNDQARKKYQKMPVEERNELMRASLQQLRLFHQDLFPTQNHWCGIFLVERDRLDAGIKKKDFAERVRKMTPSDWPEDLTIGDSTLSNFSHYVLNTDRNKAYYTMKKNPWGELCKTFWEIVKEKILTSNLRKNVSSTNNLTNNQKAYE